MTIPSSPIPGQGQPVPPYPDVARVDPDLADLPPQDEPDMIREDIEATRAQLSANVDALGEKINPKKAAERQTEKIKEAATAVKEKVFGGMHDAREGLASTTAHSASAVPRRVTASAQGSPLAAGLVAAGIGFLLGSVLPSSEKERRTVRQVKESEAVSAVTDEVKTMAKDLGDQLKEPARTAAEQVKETAQEGVTNVRETAAEAGDAVKEETRFAATAVKQDAESSAARVRGRGDETTHY